MRSSRLDDAPGSFGSEERLGSAAQLSREGDRCAPAEDLASLDQVDATAVATVLASVKSKIGAVSRYHLDRRDHQPEERHRLYAPGAYVPKRPNSSAGLMMYWLLSACVSVYILRI
jgi:hypothetical protein